MAYFTEKFPRYACDGDSISCEVDGFTLTARLERDDCGDAPWERGDGHGPVSDWRPVDSKRAGEMILNRDQNSARFYDFAAAVKIAKRDGWGTDATAAPYASGTKGERAARAVREDFEALRAWCADEWHYVGVVLTVEKNEVELYSDSLWGIECNYPGSDNSHLGEVAEEMAEAAIAAARATIAELVK